MTTDDKVRDEKLKHDINREAAKISAWPSWKLDKHKNFKGKEILSSSQRQIREQATFLYSPLGKSFEKQTEKHVVSIKSIDVIKEKDKLKEI